MRLFITLLFLSVTSLVAQAQQTGTIKGFVYDKKTGEPIIYTNVLFKENKKIGAQTVGQTRKQDAGAL